MADGKASGRPRAALNTIIAAIAEANDCIVVTGNEKYFEGIKLINPLGSDG
jgi:predicted nucleic acid-binding protein